MRAAEARHRDKEAADAAARLQALELANAAKVNIKLLLQIQVDVVRSSHNKVNSPLQCALCIHYSCIEYTLL
jgi:hypothetical protein